MTVSSSDSQENHSFSNLTSFLHTDSPSSPPGPIAPLSFVMHSQCTGTWEDVCSSREPHCLSCPEHGFKTAQDLGHPATEWRDVGNKWKPKKEKGRWKTAWECKWYVLYFMAGKYFPLTKWFLSGFGAFILQQNITTITAALVFFSFPFFSFDTDSFKWKNKSQSVFWENAKKWQSIWILSYVQDNDKIIIITYEWLGYDLRFFITTPFRTDYWFN